LVIGDAMNEVAAERLSQPDHIALGYKNESREFASR